VEFQTFPKRFGKKSHRGECGCEFHVVSRTGGGRLQKMGGSIKSWGIGARAAQNETFDVGEEVCKKSLPPSRPGGSRSRWDSLEQKDV